MVVSTERACSVAYGTTMHLLANGFLFCRAQLDGPLAEYEEEHLAEGFSEEIEEYSSSVGLSPDQLGTSSESDLPPPTFRAQVGFQYSFPFLPLSKSHPSIRSFVESNERSLIFAWSPTAPAHVARHARCSTRACGHNPARNTRLSFVGTKTEGTVRTSRCLARMCVCMKAYALKGEPLARGTASKTDEIDSLLAP